MASSDEATELKTGSADDAVPEFESKGSEMMKKENKKSDANASLLRAARAGNIEKVLELLKGSSDINASNANGLNALHLAAKEGHVTIVEEVLKRGANVDAATKKGNTALHIASLAGQLEVIGILLNSGAKVNLQSQNGFTPLYMAAQENHVQVVGYLLDHGALQTLTTEDGFTPLAVALQQGHDKVVAVLLENDSGGKVHLPALHIAAKKDDVKAAKLLLENDHNVDKISKNGSLANDTTKSGFTPLHIAAHYGNTNVAKLLIEKGSDVNFKARNFIMPLHVSSKWGRANMIALLLDSGAVIDPTTRDGLTPLHCAARSGHEQVVDLLLERGAPVTAKTKNGLSPLHMAVQGDHVDCARLLLLHKAPINDVTVDYLTPLHVAAHCGNVRTAKLLLDRKCEVNARALNGFTPLHIACKKNRIKVVELLLKYGAAIEATTESGLTPIHVAAFMGHMNIVIFLIQHGANPDFTTVRGETALHLAARANQTDIIRILLRNRAQVDARAREQQTPLHIASRLGNVDNVLLLLQHGASPDAAMKDLSTPLHIAAKEGHEEVAMILLEHGASQSLTTKKGFSTLHVAAKFGRMKVVRLLLEKGADPNVEGRNGLTPLHVATHYNHVNVALLLLEKDADPCIAAKNGYAALHIAAKKNQMDIASALFQYGAKPDDDSRNGFTPLHLATQEGHTDMVALLLEHEADANCRAKNGLTPMHLAAQEDGVPVAEILVKYGSQIDSQTKAGYTPLHTASHFGQNNMIRFLLERDASIDTKTKLGYTPLHHAAQQGHLLAVKLLLRHGAFPNNITNSGQTAMSIAQRLGYISVVEILRPVTDESASQASLDEKYKVISPEIMQEAPLSDSEDEGCDDHALPDQTFHYLVSGEMKQFQDDSVAPTMESRDLFAFEGHSRKRSMSSSMGPGIIQEEMKYMRGDDDGVDGKTTDLKTDQISRHNVGVMSSAPSGGGGGGSSYHGDCYSRPYGGSSSSAAYDVDNVIPTNTPSFSFLVSFLVDARGGAMRGCRHSGVRIVVPPNCALMPTRITCRLVKREKLMHPPPLMEGEALASRVLEMGPAGAKLLRPMVIEVPHFAALRGDEREIGILRSDDGLTWREHLTPQVDDAGHDFIQSQFEDLDATEDVQLKRLVRVVTADFPQYFALVSRVRQDIGVIGADGGVLSSKVIPQVQAVFPPASFNKTTKVGLQAQLVPPELVSKLLGNRVAVSPLVTIEPRRRKFHRPITLTIPLPKAAQKGMLNQYGSDTPNLRLLCSVSGVDTFSYLRGENGCLDISPSDWKGGVAPSVWEDITGSTPLTLVNDCVSFTTSVSARFWLMDCQNIGESTKMATDLYREVIAVPFMSKFVVFAKHLEVLEARLRVFCMTDDRIEKTLENQEHFVEVARSRDIEVLEGKPLFLEMGGNVIPVTKSGDQLVLVFRAFHENRLPFIVRIRDMSQETKSRLAFMREPRVVRGDISQSPVCNLNIRLPGLTCSPAGDQNDVAMVTRMMPTQFSMEEHIAKAELKLTDIADLLQADWIALADQLGVTDNEVTRIQSEYDYVSEQALVMLHLWVQKNENRATGNDLERALKNIGRDDVIASCMCEVKEVTDATEKAVARVYLDASYDPLKDEMGSSHEFDSSRGSSMLRGQSLDVSYDEQDILKDSESFAEETGSEAGSVVEKEDFEKKADAESAEYELEEVWDGTQWNVVRKTPLKNSEVESKTSPETNEASYERKPTLEEKTVETVEPGNAPGASEDSQRTEEVVDLDDWEVVDELPTDGDDDDEVPKGDSTPGEIDTTPEQLPYPEQRLMVESSPIGHEEEEEETEERIFTSSTVHEEETVLEDGTNVRKRVTTTRHVRISGGGKGREFPEETGQLIGTEIEEEVLILAPGVVESSGKDLQRETSVEEYEEALPDGTWEKRKVTTVTVTSRIAPFMTEEVERLAEEKEEEEEESPAVEEQSFYHSQHPVSGFSHAEDSFPEDFEHSDEIVEEKIIPQTTQRPQRVPRPQESAFSSPEEREEEEGEEEIGAVRAEYQYSGSEDFNREPVKEPEIVRENLRKVEISVDELFSTPLPPEVTLETEDTKTAGSGDDDDDDRPTTEAAPTSGDQFILGLCTPHIAVQAPSPLVQSPVEQEEKEKEEEEESGAKFEDVTGVVIVADDQDRSTEEFSSDDVTAATTCDVRADDAEEEEEEEQSGSLAAEPEIEMSGRISVDTSQQIFIEQMIETSLESTALSPTDQIRPPPPSDSSSFAAHLQSAAAATATAAVDFNRDLTIRPTDLSPLTPTPDPTEQTMPSLFDSAPSPEHDRNELEDWTRDRADEDEEGAEKEEEEEEAGSASSLSEVAQVDDVNQSQELAKEAETEEKSDETDVDEAFSPAPKDGGGFDLQRSTTSPTVFSQSPPERISPSKELALKEDVSPVTEQPRDMRKMRINVGLSPSGFIQEEEEVEEEEMVEQEEEEEEEEEDKTEEGSEVEELAPTDPQSSYFKPISPSADGPVMDDEADDDDDDDSESRTAEEATSGAADDDVIVADEQVAESSAAADAGKDEEEEDLGVDLDCERRQDEAVVGFKTFDDDVTTESEETRQGLCPNTDASDIPRLGEEEEEEEDDDAAAAAAAAAVESEKDEDEVLADRQKYEDEFSGDEEVAEAKSNAGQRLSASNQDEDLGYVDDGRSECLEEKEEEEEEEGGDDDDLLSLPCVNPFPLDTSSQSQDTGFHAAAATAEEGVDQTSGVNGAMYDDARLDLSPDAPKQQQEEAEEKEEEEAEFNGFAEEKDIGEPNEDLLRFDEESVRPESECCAAVESDYSQVAEEGANEEGEEEDAGVEESAVFESVIDAAVRHVQEFSDKNEYEEEEKEKEEEKEEEEEPLPNRGCDDEDDDVDDSSYDLLSATELEGFVEYEAARVLRQSETSDRGESSAQRHLDLEQRDAMTTSSAELDREQSDDVDDVILAEPSVDDVVQSWNSTFDESLGVTESSKGEDAVNPVDDSLDKLDLFGDRVIRSDDHNNIQTDLLDDDDDDDDDDDRRSNDVRSADLLMASIDGSYMDSSQSTDHGEVEGEAQHSGGGGGGDARIDDCLLSTDIKAKELLQDAAGVSESSGRDSWLGSSSGGAELWSEADRVTASGSAAEAADDENFVFLDESGYDPVDLLEDVPPPPPTTNTEGKDEEDEDDRSSHSLPHEDVDASFLEGSTDAEYRGLKTDTHKEREHGEHDDVSPKSADEIARWSDERKKREQEEADD